MELYRRPPIVQKCVRKGFVPVIFHTFTALKGDVYISPSGVTFIPTVKKFLMKVDFRMGNML